jgi:formamidopyrimidine-DNA glycosylase
MPEICEIILISQALKDILLGKKIIKINILSGKYMNKIFKGYNKIQYPLIIKNIESYGKLMWIEFDNNKYLLNTFGLSGTWNFKKMKNSRIELIFEENINVYYEDDRNFGTIEYDDTKNGLKTKLNNLAIDPLRHQFTKEDFLEWYKDFLSKSSKRKNMLIVKVLMNQNKKDGIVCGLGNYLVPEILYRCKISPHRKIGNLLDDEILLLAEIIKEVVKQCYIYNDTIYMKNIKDFINNHYNGIQLGKYPNYHPEIMITEGHKFIFYVYRQKHDLYGNKVIAEKIINNRSTYWVPSIQY